MRNFIYCIKSKICIYFLTVTYSVNKIKNSVATLVTTEFIFINYLKMLLRCNSLESIFFERELT